MRGWLRGIRDARVRRRLLRDDVSGEDIVDEVYHHWVVHTMPMLEVLLTVVLVVSASVVSVDVAWVFLVAAFAFLGHGAWRWLEDFMDVFVITNLRVFRVTGVFSSKHASTPLSRILDITVEQPPLGLLLRYGHFTFESAAQEQGLRDIRFVARPLQRDQTIQGLQMSTLRRSRPDRTP